MAPAPPSQDDRFPPALIALLAVVFINMMGFGVVVPLLPFFARAMHAPEWQITGLFSAYSLGQFFAEPFWGRLSDRIGRKRVLLITVFANVIGYTALAFVGDIWLAIAVRLFTGLGAGNISTIQGYIADVTSPHLRAGRMGLVGAAFGVGFIVGPALGGVLAQPAAGRLGYQLPLFVAAGLAAVSAVGVVFFLKESRVHAPPPQPPWKSLGDARSHPVIGRVLLVSLIYMGGFSGMESTLGLWAQARFDWGAREIGFCFMAVGIVSAIAQALVTGRLARRFGESRVLACGVLLFGASLIVQTLLPTSLLVPVVMAAGGFGMALAMPNISAMISQASPPGRQGAMLGLNMAAGSGARIVGPIVAGFTFTYLGPAWPFWTGALLTVPAAWVAINAGRALNRWRAEQSAPALAS
ncbi:MAG TPA: MFS transporter [Caulobacteraceae bacterium]|jgi:MFS family permease|nr:MFS transporter [Caulobacteraceae bacterium]